MNQLFQKIIGQVFLLTLIGLSLLGLSELKAEQKK